jgi:hypothetical protein
MISILHCAELGMTHAPRDMLRWRRQMPGCGANGGRLLGILLVVAMCLAAGRAQTPQWEIFEATFETGQHIDNPFTDAALQADFSKGERTMRLDGFYDGETGGRHVFRVRFAPDEQGQWTFRTMSNLRDLDGQSGTITVTAPVSRGGLVRREAFPRSFFHADGSFYYPINFGLYPHPANYGGAELGPRRKWTFPTEPEMNAFIDLIGEHGFNMFMDIRVLYQRQERITDPSYYPPYHVLDADAWKIDRDRFSLPYFQRLDRELERARRHGLFYTLQVITSQLVQQGEFTWLHSFLNPDNGGWLRDRNNDGDGDDEDEYYNLEDEEHIHRLGALVRYTLARTSACWNVMYRIDGDTRNPGAGRVLPHDVAVRWLRHWRAFVSHHDPHGRPVTIGRALESVTNEVGSDWNAIPDWSGPEITQLGGTAGAWRAAPLPEVMRGIALRGEYFWASPDYNRPVIPYETPPAYWQRGDVFELERRAYWVALASGYAWARPDSHFELLVDDPPRLYEAKFHSLPGQPPTLGYIRHFSRFMAGTPLQWERMAPLRTLVKQSDRDVYLRALPGEDYLAVFPFGGTAAIQLSSGSRDRYTARFFNPRDGSWQAPIEIAGGAPDFSAPTGEDWILVIRRKR